MSRLITKKLQAKGLKYFSVGHMTVRNNMIYLRSFFIRSWFLLVIIFIFVQLWRITYQGEGNGQIVGYTFEQMIWYLIFAECIILSSPRLSDKIEEEVKKGEVGYQLTRPMSYLLYHYCSYVGEAYVRLLVNLILGGALGLLLFGKPDFDLGLLGFLVVSIGSFTMNYIMTMMLSLCAFWVEEVRGLVFVYNKMIFIIGGMMLPLEIFPSYLRTIVEWLPFRTVPYFAAKAGVQVEWSEIGHMLLIQLIWILFLSLPLRAIYQKGVRKLHVNGG